MQKSKKYKSGPTCFSIYWSLDLNCEVLFHMLFYIINSYCIFLLSNSVFNEKLLNTNLNVVFQLHSSPDYNYEGKRSILGRFSQITRSLAKIVGVCVFEPGQAALVET